MGARRLKKYRRYKLRTAEVKCPFCASLQAKKLEGRSWLIKDMPLPHYCCLNCRGVFSAKGENHEKKKNNKRY
jgi:hypothetical protein